MDENREEQWSEKRRDDESLRGSLERDTAYLDDPKPKKKIDDEEYDVLNPFGDVRKMAESAFDEAFVDADKQEQRERDIEQFDLISKRIKRAHGVDGIDGIQRLLGAEEQLRTSPVEALQFLYHQYVEGDAAQATYQTELRNTTTEVTRFFDAHEISEDVADIMTRYIGTPQFQQSRTGDTDRDLKRAYRQVTEGMRRARMPGGRR